ncbi:MAG: carboxylating nicotinate-nucleotide diphosphorylase [Methanimicrococcus sp.]|nr:carboxylating nicotinate-nucleotide diphosphorylase [Methanimicrococcus sp.]
MLTREIEHFLEEDLRDNDISCTLVPSKNVNAAIIVKKECIISGTEIASALLKYMGISFEQKVKDGDAAKAGEIIYRLNGDSVSILRAERIVLNFLSHLSGIATNTHDCVKIIKKETGQNKPKIAATRKTIPGIRKFEKKAVFDGGGDTHRQNLADTVMIKDNHIEIMGLKNAFIEAKKQSSFTKKIEIEADTKEQALEAAKLGADILLLDNMSPEQIIETIKILEHHDVRKNVLIEASGKIRKENLKAYAKTGVDIISMSSVINDAGWIDIGLDMID